jgi:hypothetical protein
MPNGGHCYCVNCAYNPKGGVCELRDIIILGHTKWTRCENFSLSARENEVIKGPILHEGGIPWLGDRPPSIGPVKCFDCGDHVERGIQIQLRTGEKFGFCCRMNYVLWWSSRTAEYRDWAPNPQELAVCPKDRGEKVSSFVTKSLAPGPACR